MGGKPVRRSRSDLAQSKQTIHAPHRYRPSSTGQRYPFSINWNDVLQGLKKHEPSYEIVIQGVSTTELDTGKLTDAKIIKCLGEENNMKVRSIIKTTNNVIEIPKNY